MYTSRYAYATHTDWIRTHGNGPLQVSIRPVGLVQVGYTCRFDLVLIFVSCKKRHLLFTLFLNLKCRNNVPYNSRFVSNLVAAAQVMDNVN